MTTRTLSVAESIGSALDNQGFQRRDRDRPGPSGAFLLTFQRSLGYFYAMAKGSPPGKTDVLQGTLDLMVLTTLESMGPLHGYGIARRIEQISEATLRLNEGTVYTSLMRLQHQGWISATWGTSENNRKARYYAITRSGRRQLTAETKNWERIAGVIARLLSTVQQP
jgi:PadR family transcriptional regulator